MYNKVELCGVNTGQLPVLTEAEKRQLLTRARAGDKAARQSMIEGNLRLVLSVVQRFSQRGENMDDLFQVGCIGLIKAIDNFDPAQQVRFSTYGVPMIAGELRRDLRDYSPIRVSRSLRDTAYRVLQCRQQLTDANGREPSIDEIAQALDLPPAQITAALDAITREQLAAMLYRYAGSPAVSGELGFDDADSISAWARDAVRWCVDNGILNGVGGNRMTPQDLARRGQVAAMLMRFLQATV